MKKISALRKRIDEIDEQILRFLSERVNICKRIGTTKREHGIPVRDRNRENARYTYIMRRASELGLNPNEVKAVYREIIAIGIRAQEADMTSSTAQRHKKNAAK